MTEEEEEKPRRAHKEEQDVGRGCERLESQKEYQKRRSGPFGGKLTRKTTRQSTPFLDSMARKFLLIVLERAGKRCCSVLIHLARPGYSPSS